MYYEHERKERSTAPSRPVISPDLDSSLWPIMQRYLEARKLSFKIAKDNGWYPTIDYAMCPRVVIPASSLVNSWNYYQARLIVEAHPSVKRYVSPTAPRGDALAVVFPSGTASGCIIVEGPMDALAAAGLGYVGVALMGNTPGAPVLHHIRSLVETFGNCIVLPDKDAEEQGVALTAKLWTAGVKCTLKRMTGAKDLAELSPERRKILIS